MIYAQATLGTQRVPCVHYAKLGLSVVGVVLHVRNGSIKL